MKKILLIGLLFLSCNDNKPILNSLDTDRPDSHMVNSPLFKDTILDKGGDKYYYMYMESLNHGQRGIYKTDNGSLKAGDRVMIDKDCVVEILEPVLIKK